MYDVFSLPETRFPAGFLWGSGTAGHQIEGNNVHSQHWEWEKKGTSPSGKACNHWELFRQDVDLIGTLGHQVYRMSVEWSRIEPVQGARDESALRHYLDELTLLKKKGLQVFVTLHHFTHPQWFEALGGFNKPENLRFFEEHLNFLVPKISSLVDGWNVINEFNLRMAPDSGPFKANMLRAHARGYHVIKQYSKAPVSTAHAFVHWYPRRFHDRLDNTMQQYVDFITNEFFFHAIRTGEIVHPYMDAQVDNEVKGTCDYWAVNHYTRHMIDARKAGFEGPRFAHMRLKMIKQDFYLEEMYPEGLTANLERLKDLPVIITENGCACDDDRFRIVYIALYLSAVKEAMDRGVDVRGYLYWSLMDNYEWGSFVPRFGLVHVDFETFVRTPKPSAAFFADIIRGNGFDASTIRKHLSQLPTLSPI